MTNKSNNNSDFSIEFIRPLLDQNLYNKRDLSEKEYIDYCKKLWDETEVQSDGRKIIFDDLMENAQSYFFPDLKLDHTSWYHSSLNDGTESDSDYSPEQLDTLEDVDIMGSPLFEKGYLTKDDFIKLADLYQNAAKKHRYDGLRCLVVLQGKNVAGDFVKTSLAEWQQTLEERTFEESTNVESYFIALFDILGFSKLIENIGTMGVIERYQRLMQQVLDNTGYRSTTKVKVDDNLYYPSIDFVPIKHTYFSDTIILWAEHVPEHFSTFLVRCCDLLCEGLEIGLPLRGAISCGDAIMHASSNTFVGEAIVEAAKMESAQAWIGGTLCTSIILNNLYPQIDEELVVPMYVNHLKPMLPDSHFKQKFDWLVGHEKPYLALDWMERWEIKKPSIDLDELLLSYQQQAPAKNQVYYENTFDFFFYALGWGPKQRGDYLRSTFFSFPAYKKQKLSVLRELDANENQPIIIVFKNGTYKCGFVLPVRNDMEVSDKGLLKRMKSNFLFIDFLFGGFNQSFYKEIKEKQFDELETRLFIEEFQYQDVFSVDAYNFDADKYAGWDDQQRNRQNLTEYVKKKKII